MQEMQQQVVFHTRRREVGLLLRPDDTRVGYSVVRFGGDTEVVVRYSHLEAPESLEDLAKWL